MAVAGLRARSLGGLALAALGGALVHRGVTGHCKGYDLLGVDTAADLLHDPATHELVATAAKGLEKEVRPGVRVPMGAGFAGRIGVDRRPVVIPDIERAEIWNPILRETGIR